MLDQNKLYESLLSWIDNNQPKVAIAQKMANEINNLHLINSYRKLPFEIVPVDNEAEEFKLTVFLDHPKLGSWDLAILDDGISITNLDKPEEAHDLKTYENIFDFINEFDDENAKIYHDFQLAVESRNYTIVNKLLSSELKKYHEAIDHELKSIKKILTSTENSGLTNPSDGSVSYLNRVMGRWDLALLWTPCPFVVVSDPELTWYCGPGSKFY